MIFSVAGILELKEPNRAVVNASGIGYEIVIPLIVYEVLPAVGDEIKLFTVESVAMYGGGTTLYGFLTEEQKSIYLCIKEFVPSTGAKKSLDYLDKASKSLPDFRRAILVDDPQQLTGIFGFSRKAAEKIIAGLKDRLDKIQVTGQEKWSRAGKLPAVSDEAIQALIALGFKPHTAHELVGSNDSSLPVEQIIKNALKVAGEQKR